MSKVPKYIAIKYMCEILYTRSKEWNVEGVKGVEDTLYRFQCIQCYLCRRRQRWYLQLLRTLYAEYRFHVGDVKESLYTVAPRPAQAIPNS